MSRSAIILPDKSFDLKVFERIVDIVTVKYGEDILYFTLQTLNYNFQENVIELNNNHITQNILDNYKRKFNIARIIIMRNNDNTNPPLSWENDLEFPFYRPLDYGIQGIRPVGNSYYYDIIYQKENIFKTLNSNEVLNNTIFYPYQFFQNINFLGNINCFGFRGDYTYSANDKLVIITGGSGCFDLCSKKEDTLYFKLEKKLKYVNKNFKVINFCMPGHVLNDHISSYQLFIRRMNPYLIISYDGVNDFLNGIRNDSFLIEKYALNYSNVYENIAKQINKSELTDGFCSFKEVAKAYLKRKIQFQEMVESNKGYFLSILQPFLYSKSGYSKEELNSQISKFTEAYQMISKGYEFLYTLKINNKLNNFLDMHGMFKKFDHKSTLFNDTIYQFSNCNDIIVEMIIEKLNEKELI